MANLSREFLCQCATDGPTSDLVCHFTSRLSALERSNRFGRKPSDHASWFPLERAGRSRHASYWWGNNRGRNDGAIRLPLLSRPTPNRQRISGGIIALPSLRSTPAGFARWPPMLRVRAL